jgi:hypothetical protein
MLAGHAPALSFRQERRRLPTSKSLSSRIPEAILDQLLGRADAKTAFDGGALIDQLKKALTECALNAANHSGLV